MKYFFCIYKTNNGIHSASNEIKCPKSGIFTNKKYYITGWGQSGKVILQVSIAVFSGAVKKSKKISDKDGSAP